MRYLACGLALFSTLGSIGTLAHAEQVPPTDRIAFWDFKLSGNATAHQLDQARERIAQALEHSDSGEYFYWALKEMELSGAFLGDMVLDAQILESFQMQLLWGHRQVHLMGTPWELRDIQNALEQIGPQIRSFSKSHRDLFLLLRGSLNLKKKAESEVRAKQWEEHEHVLLAYEKELKLKQRIAHWQSKGVFGSLWNWITSSSKQLARLTPVGTQELQRAQRAALYRELPAWTDEEPLGLTAAGKNIGIPAEFAEGLIDAFWGGLVSRVGHLMPSAGSSSQKFTAVYNFTQLLLGTEKFSLLDGTDVKHSCVASLAAKKRN